jgi:hypothetical protein
VALVGVEVHLPVRQGADRLAVLADVRDQHDRGVAAHELLGVDHSRRPEHFRETDLIPFAQLLVAQQDDEMPVPGVPELRAGLFIDVLAQIDADDLGAQRRRQRPHRQCRRWERGLGVRGSRFHPGRSPWRTARRHGCRVCPARLWAAREPVLKVPWRRPG